MSVYKNKQRLTISGEQASSPEEALKHVSDEAKRVLGGMKLIQCEITASKFTGNAWDVEATFEQEGPS